MSELNCRGSLVSGILESECGSWLRFVSSLMFPGRRESGACEVAYYGVVTDFSRPKSCLSRCRKENVKSEQAGARSLALCTGAG